MFPSLVMAMLQNSLQIYETIYNSSSPLNLKWDVFFTQIIQIPFSSFVLFPSSMWCQIQSHEMDVLTFLSMFNKQNCLIFYWIFFTVDCCMFCSNNIYKNESFPNDKKENNGGFILIKFYHAKCLKKNNFCLNKIRSIKKRQDKLQLGENICRIHI